MAVKKLRVSELDFDGIKSNLINFLKSDEAFGAEGSYNYEGSAMSALLDVLAYNTHYMGYYVNILANEMFLDSASKRESIVSIAKHLGYTPASSKSASITFDITSDSLDPPSIVKTDEFIGVGEDGVEYKFYPDDIYPKSLADNSVTGIVCKEGKKVTKEYIKDSNNLDQKFLLDSGVDTDTLLVKVKSEEGGTDKLYTKFNDISELTSISTTYFLQEVSAGQFEVVFGDGDFGNKLSEGSIITFEYLISSGEGANGITTLSTETSTVTGMTITSNSTGGQGPQSNESVRFLAPKSFQAQNRAVTLDDFKIMLREKGTNVKSSIVWGGEDNDPPMYGKVFLCCQPITGEFLTDTDKIDNIAMLSTNKIIGITPEILDPEYVYIDIDSVVIYNTKLNINPEGAIKENIINSIKNYGDTVLNDFEGEFQFTPFVALIDDTDVSIVSNYTTLKMYKKINPNGDDDLEDSWDLQFNTAIENLTSSEFQLVGGTQSVSFKSSGTDIILVDSTGTTISTSHGTITDGKVSIDPININGTADIKVYVEVDRIDIAPYFGTLLNIDQIEIKMVRS